MKVFWLLADTNIETHVHYSRASSKYPNKPSRSLLLVLFNTGHNNILPITALCNCTCKLTQKCRVRVKARVTGIIFSRATWEGSHGYEATVCNESRFAHNNYIIYS